MAQTTIEKLDANQLLKIIFDYMSKISSANQLKDVLVLMANMGKEMIFADRCTVWLIDERNEELYTAVAHGVDELRIPLNSGIVGHAILTGETIIIDDAKQDVRHYHISDEQNGYVTKSMITVPFRNHEDKIIGAYQAINKLTPQAKFTTQDIEYLSLAASYAGKSLETVMLHEEIIKTQKEIIAAMGEIGELRSKETGNHVKRVAAYSYILAKGLGLSERDADILRTVSPMHDIGKIAISDTILNKPERLTNEEFELIKNHTTVGYELLRSSPRELLRAAAVVAHEHHEKWNGTGYPRGLKGEEIHIFGRITAVADVFDALGADRVYKKAWSIDRIKTLFEEESGQHFDPKIVEIFFKKLPELINIGDEFDDNFKQ